MKSKQHDKDTDIIRELQKIQEKSYIINSKNYKKFLNIILSFEEKNRNKINQKIRTKLIEMYMLAVSLPV